MTVEEELFSSLERELDESAPDRHPSAVWREQVRHRILRRTITTHNDELGSVLRFPWGMSWRRVDGVDWCPYCTSISPTSMTKILDDLGVWSPTDSIVEFSRLVARGEMDPSSDAARNHLYDPMPGTGYGMYAFAYDEPTTFHLVQSGRRRVAMSIEHIYDLAPPDRSRLFGHLNRMSPVLHWSLDREGHPYWSMASFASGLSMSMETSPEVELDDDPPLDLDDDDDDPDDHGDPPPWL